MQRRVLPVGLMLIAVAATPLAAQTAPPEQIEFRRIPEPGRVFHHRVQIQSVGTTNGIKFVQNMGQWVAIECKQTNPDGSAVVEMTMERLAMRMSAPILGRIDIDTMHPTTKPSNIPVMNTIAKLLESLVGTKITMDVDPQGHPLRVQGMREALNKIQERLAQEGPDAEGAAMLKPAMDALGGAFDDDTLTQQMSCYALMLPKENRPYSVGESWENQMEAELGMLGLHYTTQGTYQLQAIEPLHDRPHAKIRMKENFRIAPRPADEQQNPPAGGNFLAALLKQMDLQLNASGSEGVAYWDYQQGIMTQMRQTQRMTIEGKSRKEPSAGGTGKPEFVQRLTTAIEIDLVNDATETGSMMAPPKSAAQRRPAATRPQDTP